MARISYIGDSGEPLELVVGADNPEVMIGRHRSCAIRTSTQSVSRHHARVYFDGQHYWLQDNGSSNGTYYQNQRLTPQEPVSIEDGEFFMCGNFEMRFDLDDEDLAMLAGDGEEVFTDTMDDVLVEYESDEPAVPEATAFMDVDDDDAAPPTDFSDVADDEWEYDDVPPPPTGGRSGGPIPPPPGSIAPLPDVQDDDLDELDELHDMDDLDEIPLEDLGADDLAADEFDADSGPVAVAGSPDDARLIEELRASLAQRTREVENQDSKIQGLEIELESLGSRLEEIGGAERLGELVEELDALRPLTAQLEASQADLATAQLAGGATDGQLDDLRSEVATRDGEIEALKAEAEEQKVELGRIRDALATAEEAAAATTAGGESTGRIEALEREVDELQEEVDHAKEKYEEARAGRRNAEELASLLRTQSEMGKQAADTAKAEVERLKKELAAAQKGNGGADAAAALARAEAAETQLAAVQEQLVALETASDGADSGGGVDLREVAELKHTLKEKDNEIARLWAQVEEAKASTSGAGPDVEAAQADAAQARAEAEALRAKVAAAEADAGAAVELRAQLEAIEAEREDLEHAASANMKRMKKLMDELEDARSAGGPPPPLGDSGASAALQSEIELLRRELAAAEAARDEAMKSAGGGTDAGQVNGMVNELNGVVSSFRSDFMQVVDAFELIRSDDDGDRTDGMEQMQEGLDACQGRAGELKNMVRSLKSAVE